MLDIRQKAIEDFNDKLLKNKTKIVKYIKDNYKIDYFLHISNFYKILHYIKNYRFCKLKYFILEDFAEQQLYKVIKIYTGYTENRTTELIAYMNIYNIDNFKI